MVLAGSNPAWNTIRYLCPLCSAAGRPMLEMAAGVVSGYWPDRGYGFVDNGGPRIFFHVSDLAGQFTPYAGMPVTCLVEQNEKGLIGRQVQPR
jgi:cold shock CspA family protein